MKPKWPIVVLAALICLLYVLVMWNLAASASYTREEIRQMLGISDDVASSLTSSDLNQQSEGSNRTSDDIISDDEARDAHPKPKTVMRYVNTHETVYAARVDSCTGPKMMEFTFGDELECVESTLGQNYVEVLLEGGIYIIEGRFLSLKEPKPFKVSPSAVNVIANSL